MPAPPPMPPRSSPHLPKGRASGARPEREAYCTGGLSSLKTPTRGESRPPFPGCQTGRYINYFLCLRSRKSRRKRGEEHPVPERLDRRGGGEEGEADPRRSGEESGVVPPAELGRRLVAHRQPGLVAADPLPRPAEGEGLVEPGAGGRRQALVAGRLVEPVEEVGVAGGPVAEAGVDHPGARDRPAPGVPGD